MSSQSPGSGSAAKLCGVPEASTRERILWNESTQKAGCKVIKPTEQAVLDWKQSRFILRSLWSTFLTHLCTTTSCATNAFVGWQLQHIFPDLLLRGLYSRKCLSVHHDLLAWVAHPPQLLGRPRGALSAASMQKKKCRHPTNSLHAINPSRSLGFFCSHTHIPILHMLQKKICRKTPRSVLSLSR
jgi:hypothetical protein